MIFPGRIKVVEVVSWRGNDRLTWWVRINQCTWKGMVWSHWFHMANTLRGVVYRWDDKSLNVRGEEREVWSWDWIWFNSNWWESTSINDDGCFCLVEFYENLSTHRNLSSTWSKNFVWIPTYNVGTISGWSAFNIFLLDFELPVEINTIQIMQDWSISV